MRKRMRFTSNVSVKIATMLTVLSVLLVACAPTPAPEATQPVKATATSTAQPTIAPTETPPKGPQGTLTVLQGLLPIVPDPHKEYLTSSWNVNYAIYDPLTLVDENMKLIPKLATSWRLEAPTSWIFEIRKGVKFHDGSPLTAKDVVWSLARIRDPETKSIWGRIYSYVTDAEIVDEYTVRIKTAFPEVAVPQDFGRMCILPQEAFERMGEEEFFQHPIGSGPFKLVKNVPGEEIVMEANEDYWGGVPKVKTLVWRGVPEEATRVAELLSGRADVVHGIPASEADRIKKSDIASLALIKSVRNLYIDMDLRQPPFDDIRCREAVALAIDAQAIIDSIYGGRAYLVGGWLSDYTWGQNPDLEPYPYDPERAKALLAEAGYPDGLSCKFTMGRGRFVQDEEVGLAIADQLGKAGFDIDFEVLEWGTYSTKMNAGELTGIHMVASGNTTGEPDQMLRSVDIDRNDVYIQSEELTDMVHKSMAEGDLDKRKQLIMAIDKKIHEEYLSLCIFALQDIYGVSNRVHGFQPSPNELMWFLDVSVD